MKKIKRIIDFRNDIYNDVACESNNILDKKEHALEYTREKKFSDSDIRIETKSTVNVSNHFNGKINRKLVKRNVMTTPYSVSKRGMFFQIKEILEDLKAKGKSMFIKGDEDITLKLLTDVNELSISRIIKGAKVGQNFLVDITKRLMIDKRKEIDAELRQSVKDYKEEEMNIRKLKIMDDKIKLDIKKFRAKKLEKLENVPIIWTTLMGFPVVQWYKSEKNIRIETPLVKMQIKQKGDKLDKNKQKSGIAPNLIHSLDANLLQFTVEKLIDKEVDDFMLIHDSFSVLPNNVDMLDVAFRESYVEIFKTNPLETFIKEVYPAALEELDEIMINDLDLDEVLDSNYIIC